MLYLLCLTSICAQLTATQSASMSALQTLQEAIAAPSSYSELIAYTDTVVDELRIKSVIAEHDMMQLLEEIMLKMQDDIQDLYIQAYEHKMGYDRTSCARKGHWTTAAVISSLTWAGYNYLFPAKSCDYNQAYAQVRQQIRDQGGQVYEGALYTPYSGNTTQEFIISTPLPVDLWYKLQNAWLAKNQSAVSRDPLNALLAMSTFVTVSGAVLSWIQGSSSNHIVRTIARSELVLQRLMGWLNSLNQQNGNTWAA